MLRRWKRQPRVGGEIVYHQLEDWWFSTFTYEQRQKAASIYCPLNGKPSGLVESEICWSSSSRVHFLTYAATSLSKPGGEEIALAFADRLAAELGPHVPLVERHFAYSALCRIFYRWRNIVPGSFEKAVTACEASVTMAHELGGTVDPPGTEDPIKVSHYCYEQLIIIEKKRGNFERAISLCRQAQSEGWVGNWDHAIASIEKMQARQK